MSSGEGGPFSPKQLDHIKSLRSPVRAWAEDLARLCRTNNADDLFQIGMEGVCLEIHEFDGDRSKVTTFMYPRVRARMLNACRIERTMWAKNMAMTRAARVIQMLGDFGDFFDETEEQRRERARDHYDAAAAAMLIGLHTFSDADPQTLLLISEEQRRVEQAVNRVLEGLEPLEQTLVRRTPMGGEDLNRVAEQLGIGYGQAKYRLRGALAAMNRRLRVELGDVEVVKRQRRVGASGP